MKRIALFLDRDGTLIVDKHYMSNPDNIEFLPGVIESISNANDFEIPIIVVTNQSGVGRGLFTEEQLGNIHYTLTEMLRESGCYITDIYYCPHHPDDGCLCRKPGTALFERAGRDYGLSITDCIIIGDSIMDAGAAINIGCASIIPAKRKHGVADAINTAVDILYGVNEYV